MKRLSRILTVFFFLVTPAWSAFAETASTSSNPAGLITGGGGTNAGGQSVQADEFSGAATYSITIPVPPSRGGIEPQLVLNYNSHRKNPNSWVGYGWELDLGAIERLPESGIINYYDGESFQVRFSGQTETLQLKSPNISPSTYGLSVGSSIQVDQYEAKIESAFNLYFHLRDYSDPNDIRDAGWIVIDKGGRKYEFGTANEGREETSRCAVGEDATSCSSQNWVARWFLQKVTDPNDNILNINYDASLHPISITYQDIIIEFSFDFAGSSNFSYFPTYRQGFGDRTHMGVLLDYITIKKGTLRLQKFNFTYSTSTFTGAEKLSSIQQFGGDDSEALPATTFDYFDQSTLSWSPISYDMAGSVTTADGYTDGFLNYYVQFVDMNADGLPDKVVAYKDNPIVHVYYNNGSDFVEIPGRSEWNDPIATNSCEDPAYCNGQLNQYYNDPYNPHQFVYLMDINGDTLPDRVRAVPGSTGRDDQKDFEVYVNTGNGWNTSYELWRDPYIGNYPGTSDNNNFFMDMNGDGLIDRVKGSGKNDGYEQSSGYFVYYNTGKGFKATPVFWSDPYAIISPDSNAVGRLTGTDEDTGEVHGVIRDFNGDGLPDRIFKANIIDDSTHTSLGIGIAIALNRNGLEWAQPTVLSDGHIDIDGIDNLSIKYEDSDNHDMITETDDWIDMNGDGYLDRVEGDKDAGNFEIRFYTGMEYNASYSSLSNAVTISDPVDNNDGDSGFKADGMISASHAPDDGDTDVGRALHTFIADLNGDGFPDRLTLTPRSYDDGTKTWKFYPMQINTVQYSDSPSTWANQNVPQPLLGLKSVDDGQGNQLAIEYMPSTWPLRWPSPNHRILPFNLYLVHKLYSTDYSMPDGDATPEASRHDGMRWTTYNFWGGNLFTKSSIHCNEADISSAHEGDICYDVNPYTSYEDDSSGTPIFTQVYFGDVTSNAYIQFNGFQSVEKQIYKPTGETWDDFKTVTYYHQTLGEVDTVDAADEPLFDTDGYSHYAFSGKPYKNEIKTDAYTIVSEESAYEVNTTSSSDTFTCDGTCYPKLSSTTKTVLESASSTSRISTVSYAYDNYGNITNQTYYDGSGTTLLEKDTTYFPETSFDTDLQIHDRPETQTQSLGGTIYREKQFAYDHLGNPTTEQFLEDASTSTYQTISRGFDTNGNMDEITDVDGVSKTMTYDADGLFPLLEQMTLPSGSTLTITRDYNRMNGKPTEEIDDNGVGKITDYDDFGRPTEEYIQDASGARTELKSYDYTYLTENVEGRNITLLKTEIYEPQTDHPETTAFPMHISYTDGSGGILQQCELAERLGYRLVQFRNANGGRLSQQTEPVFDLNCAFKSSISASTPTYQTQKDIQGRITYSDPPPSDTDSPIGWVSTSYSTDADGHLVKETTTEAGDTTVETYDANERLTKLVDTQNSTLIYTYNPVGDLVNVTNDSTSLTTITYDDMGRKVQMDDANLGTWRYEYDGNGRMWKQTDNKGQYITFTYDDAGRLTQKDIYDSTGAKEKYEVYTYDSGDAGYDVKDGELFKVEEFDKTGTSVRSTKFSYDALYRRINKVTRTIPDLGDFDQTMTSDFRGMTQSTTYPGGETVYYKYDPIGNLMNVCSTSDCDSSSGEVYYSIDPYLDYNVYGGLLKETFGNGVVTEFEYYDLSHRLYKKKTHKGTSTYSERTYKYDLYSNLTDIGDPLNSKGSGAISSVSYDSLSRLTSYMPSGSSTPVTFSYDAQGNMLSNSKSYGTDAYEYTSSRPHAVTKIGSKNFDYDDNGNMISDPNRVMTYNAQNQLTTVTMTNKTVIEYDYDYTSARTDKTVTQTDPSLANHISKTYYLGDAMEIRDNQVILHIYAKNTMVATKGLGSLDELLASSSSDLRDLHIQPNLRFSTLVPFLLLFFPLFVMFSFRPIGLKVPMWVYLQIIRSKTQISATKPTLIFRAYCAIRACTMALHEAIQAFPLGMAPKLITLFLALLFTVEMPLHEAFAGDSGYLPNASDSTYFYYHHGDHLGSSHVITEGNTAGGKHSGLKYNQGDLIQRYEYAPYGQETYVLNPNLEFDPSYTGQKYDAESGLYYYNARYYNPELGRFIQADTVVPDTTNLQAHNRYSYTANNPLKYVDPSGHGFWSWFKKILGAFIGALIGVLTAALTLGVALGVEGATISALFANATFGQLIIASAAGGLLGGAIGGGISAGIRGAIAGAIFGFVGGAIFSAAGFGLNKVVGDIASKAIMFGIGAGLSYASGGWKGLVLFGVGILGAVLGGEIGDSMLQRNNIGGIGGGDPEKMNKLMSKLISENSDAEEGKLKIPPGVDIVKNVDEAKKLSPLEFYNKVKTGGEWDYKSIDPDYENFGNYHFGIVGKANGWADDDLLIGAGLYQIKSGTSNINWYGTYFDEPKDQYWIQKGINDYYKKYH